MYEHHVGYQARLRAVGAYLDAHTARSISLIETPEGFTVRYQRNRLHCDEVAADLAFGELDSFQTELEWERTAGRAGNGTDGDTEPSYQDFLRVLGYELERAEAQYVVLDEVEDTMALSYLYSDPRQGYLWAKRLVKIGAQERQAAIRSAHRRRKSDDGLLGRLIQGQVPGIARRRRPAESGPLWEAGEREVYRTVLQVAWTGPGKDHVDTDLLLTSRRIVLHFQGGGMDRTLLDDVTSISTHTSAGPLLKLYAVDVHRRGRNHLSLECLDQAHQARLAGHLEEALSPVRA